MIISLPESGSAGALVASPGVFAIHGSVGVQCRLRTLDLGDANSVLSWDVSQGYSLFFVTGLPKPEKIINLCENTPKNTANTDIQNIEKCTV